MDTFKHAFIGVGVVGILLFFSSYFKLNFMGTTFPTVMLSIAIFLLVSIFIDVDHIVALGLKEGNIPFNLKELYNKCASFGIKQRALVFFHTFEFVLLLTLISMKFSYYIILIAVLIHLTVDYIHDPWRLKLHTWFSYNLIQHLKNKDGG